MIERPLKQLDPVSGRSTMGNCQSRKKRRSLVELLAPKSPCRFLKNRDGIGEQFHVKQNAAFEGVVPQNTLAKPVNGKNSSVIEILHRKVQVADALPDVAALQILRYNIIVRFFQMQVVERVAQPLAHTVTQLLCRSYGVSDCEDLFDWYAQLKHEPQDDARDRECFSRTSACLDECHSLSERRTLNLESIKRFHASWFRSIGSKTSSASLVNS